jgi:hypothetical protein
MKLKTLKIIYNFFVLVLYFLFGTLLLVKYTIWQEVPDFRMVAFGVVVLCYGAFRGFRAYQEYKSKDEGLNDHE